MPALLLLLLLAAAAAVCFPNLIHATLALALAFALLGAAFLALGAEFAGFVQILVNVGAVAVLIAFVVLITRPERITIDLPSGAAWTGALAALVLGATLVFCVVRTPLDPGPLMRGAAAAPSSAKAIGTDLIGAYLLPLQLLGLLLTAALVGAALLARDEPGPGESEGPDR